MQGLLLVFVGGGLGSCARYALSQYIPPVTGTFPWATFAANMLACLLLGILFGLETKTSVALSGKLLLAVGFCGGFSTFSTFGLESLRMLQQQELLLLLSYVAASLLLGVIAVYAGLKLTQLL